MAPRATPTIPSHAEFIRLVSGPKVDIYVGENKKHYSLPKDLLAYYSPYFNRCFNGGFVEAETQTLELLEDEVEDFEILLQYMLHGSIFDLVIDTQDLRPFDTCMQFVEYVDKYDLGDLASAVCVAVKGLLENGARYKSFETTCKITGSHIERVFQTTSVGNPLRKLIVQGVISQYGPYIGTSKTKFTEQEEKVDGFAAALLSELRHCHSLWKWTDPITRASR